jgi:hypothetical protein
MKEKVLREVDRALSVEQPIGFIAVAITKCSETGNPVPTIIDAAHADMGQVDSEKIREAMRALGSVISEELAGCTSQAAGGE